MKGTTIAIANAAGSAGKTTTGVTLAVLLAERGHPVTVVDADPQANASTWLATPGPGLARVLVHDATADDALVQTRAAGVSLLAADRSLEAVGVELGRVPVGAQMRLRKALRARTGPVDLTIIDCPGSMSLLTILALMAADNVVSVVTPGVKEIEPIPQVAGAVQDICEAYDTDLRLAAIVPCIVPPVNAGRLYTEALHLLEQTWPGLPTSPVRRSVRVGEAYAAREPLPVFAPREAVTQDYVRVLDELIARGVIQ